MTTYGTSIFGKSLYGFSVIFRDPRNCLFSLTAKKKLEKAPVGFRGIYQTYKAKDRKSTRLLKLYRPTNPRTEFQQANRQKIANAVYAWQLLTKEQQSVYNERSSPPRMSGYNRFIKEYLKS